MGFTFASGLSFFYFLPNTDDDGRLERPRRGEACARGCLSGWCLARKMITRDIDVLLMKIECVGAAGSPSMRDWWLQGR